MNVSEQDWSAGYRRGYDDAKRDYSNVVEASPVPKVQPAPGAGDLKPKPWTDDEAADDLRGTPVPSVCDPLTPYGVDQLDRLAKYLADRVELVVVRLENLEKRVAFLDDWSHTAAKQIMDLNARLDALEWARKYESKLAAERFTGSVENREWFLSVDQFISRADSELHEINRALGRTVKKCRKLDE